MEEKQSFERTDRTRTLEVFFPLFSCSKLIACMLVLLSKRRGVIKASAFADVIADSYG